MRRGDIYLVDLDPARGSEANKLRPAIIVSNNAANRVAERGRGVVTVVPITSNVSRVFAFQVRLPAGEGGLAVASKAQAEQVRSVDSERLRRRVGTVSPATLTSIDEALRTHLGL